MDAYSLLYDFDGTFLDVSMGDFEKWIIDNCGNSYVRQLLSEFIVEKALGPQHGRIVIASDSVHYFDIPVCSSSLILCDFSSADDEYLHLRNWTFTVVDGSKVSGHLSFEELMTLSPSTYDYYSLEEILNNELCG